MISSIYFYILIFIIVATVKGTGICRFGWSTMAAHYEIGKDAYGFGFGGSGMKSFNGTFEAYGVKYVDGAVIGCLLDLEKREISYSINGINHGVAFILPETLINTIWFPAFVFKGAGASFNFGNADFKYLPSSEYSNIVHAHPSHVISSTSKEAYTQSSNIRLPVAIVLEPSRELAEQVDQNIDELSRYIVNPKVESLLIVGGEDNKKISKTLSKGCDIIVGTLGKISECVKSKILDLSQIRFFILDEADRMTESDSLAQIMTLYAACPVGGTGDNRLQVSCCLNYCTYVCSLCLYI